MPLITPEQGHFDQLLTDYMRGFTQDDSGFLAATVGTAKPVNFQSGAFWSVPKGTFFRTEAGPRPLNGPPRERTTTMTTDTYKCSSKWIATSVDDEVRANATPPYDPEQEAVQIITADLMLRREIDFQTQAFTASAWTTAYTGESTGANVNSGASQVLQWDQSGALPGTQIRTLQNTVKLLTGRKPNVLALGADIAVTMTDNPDYQDKVKYTSGGIIKDVTDPKVAEYFGVDEVLIADAIEDTSDTPTGFNGAFIMDPKSALLVYRSPNLGLMTATGITVFMWSDLLGSGAYDGVIFRGRNDEHHKDWFHGAIAYDIHVTAPDMGVFFSALQA